MNHSYTNRQNELSMKDLFSKWEKFGNKCRVFLSLLRRHHVLFSGMGTEYVCSGFLP